MSIRGRGLLASLVLASVSLTTPPRALSHEGFEPPPGGFTSGGSFNAWNVTLLAHMPLSSIGGGTGNVVEGWTDPVTGKDYALFGRTGGTSFIDISTPTSPIYLGELPKTAGASVSQYWRDVQVYNDHAFVVSDLAGPHGMQVFDLTRLRGLSGPPQIFTEDAHYSGFENAHTLAINKDSGFAYAVGTNTFGGGLHIVNVQNPLSPTFAGSYSADGYIHETQVVNYAGPDSDYVGREIAFNANGYNGQLAITDVTNKASPTSIFRKNYPNPGYSHQGWLTDDQQYFLLDDELDGINGTVVFDVSDLDNPVVIGRSDGTSTAIDHNQYVLGNLVYQANYTSGLRILELTHVDDAHLHEMAYFDIVPENDLPNFDGAWDLYPYLDDNVVLISGIGQGLFIVQFTPVPEPAVPATLTWIAFLAIRSRVKPRGQLTLAPRC